MSDDADIDAPNPSPYPDGAEPDQLAAPAEDGDEIEMYEVTFSEGADGRRGAAPFVIAVASGVVASMVYEGGSWLIKEAWKAGTREPVPAPRPPVLYDERSGLTYVRQGDGTYTASGPATSI